MSSANQQAREKAKNRKPRPHGYKVPKEPRFNENGAMFIDDAPKLWTPPAPCSECPCPYFHMAGEPCYKCGHVQPLPAPPKEEADA